MRFRLQPAALLFAAILGSGAASYAAPQSPEVIGRDPATDALPEKPPAETQAQGMALPPESATPADIKARHRMRGTSIRADPTNLGNGATIALVQRRLEIDWTNPWDPRLAFNRHFTRLPIDQSIPWAPPAGDALTTSSSPSTLRIKKSEFRVDVSNPWEPESETP
jgi:hypothetical protein